MLSLKKVSVPYCGNNCLCKAASEQKSPLHNTLPFPCFSRIASFAELGNIFSSLHKQNSCSSFFFFWYARAHNFISPEHWILLPQRHVLFDIDTGVKNKADKLGTSEVCVVSLLQFSFASFIWGRAQFVPTLLAVSLRRHAAKTQIVILLCGWESGVLSCKNNKSNMDHKHWIILFSST